ncbi:MAG TPA: hypothetical protein VNN76_01925 [Bacteroidota bacterium]|nr:hypothetical protein [Bacteroidota bacterium]
MTRVLPYCALWFKLLLLGFAINALLCSAAMAQEIRVQGGNPILTITAGVPGGQPIAVTNSTTSIRYRRQTGLTTKITVQTVCPGQKFNLQVVAINVTAGTPAPAVTLTTGMLATNLITNIPPRPPTNESCTLVYTASSTFAQGNSVELGDDVHTVVYTLIAQ